MLSRSWGKKKLSVQCLLPVSSFYITHLEKFSILSSWLGFAFVSSTGCYSCASEPWHYLLDEECSRYSRITLFQRSSCLSLSWI